MHQQCCCTPSVPLCQLSKSSVPTQLLFFQMTCPTSVSSLVTASWTPSQLTMSEMYMRGRCCQRWREGQPKCQKTVTALAPTPRGRHGPLFRQTDSTYVHSILLTPVSFQKLHSAPTDWERGRRRDRERSPRSWPVAQLLAVLGL